MILFHKFFLIRIVMLREAMLNHLGYKPNDALMEKMGKIIANTKDYEKIEKHIADLHDHLKVNKGFVAISNSEDYLKIKIESGEEEMVAEAINKIEHFAEKYKVKLDKVEGKNTFYILGFNK